MRIKIVFCAVLAAVAMLCMTATLADIGVLDSPARGGKEYLIRESGGQICVYKLPDSQTPLFVSTISADTLPVSRRAELAFGICAEDYEQMRRLLEDMGA